MSEPSNRFARALHKDPEDTEFDLAGYTDEQAEVLVKEMFGTPLAKIPAAGIKVSFVVGGGKAVRSRYPDGLTKALTTNLRAIGFSEDSGAAAGDNKVWKHQHDTGANLMRLHVFLGGNKPAAGGASSGSGGGAGEPPAAVLNHESPRYVAALMDMERFPKLVASKVVSWTQKKRLKEVLEGLLALLKSCDEKLATLQPLTAEEQEWYNDLPQELLEEKIKHLAAGMKEMVTAGQLLAKEKEEVVGQATSRLGEMEKEMTRAKEGGAPAGRVAAMEAAVTATKERVAAIQRSGTIESHPVKNAGEMVKLVRRRAAYLAMKAAVGNKMLSLAEAKEMSSLEDANNELLELEEAGQGWYETEEEYRARLTALYRTAGKAGRAK